MTWVASGNYDDGREEVKERANREVDDTIRTETEILLRNRLFCPTPDATSENNASRFPAYFIARIG